MEQVLPVAEILDDGEMEEGDHTRPGAVSSFLQIGSSVRSRSTVPVVRSRSKRGTLASIGLREQLEQRETLASNGLREQLLFRHSSLKTASRKREPPAKRTEPPDKHHKHRTDIIVQHDTTVRAERQMQNDFVPNASVLLQMQNDFRFVPNASPTGRLVRSLVSDLPGAQAECERLDCSMVSTTIQPPGAAMFTGGMVPGNLNTTATLHPLDGGPWDLNADKTPVAGGTEKGADKKSAAERGSHSEEGSHKASVVSARREKPDSLPRKGSTRGGALSGGSDGRAASTFSVPSTVTYTRTQEGTAPNGPEKAPGKTPKREHPRKNGASTHADLSKNPAEPEPSLENKTADAVHDAGQIVDSPRDANAETKKTLLAPADLHAQLAGLDGELRTAFSGASEKTFKKAFDMADADKNGLISAKEVARMLQSLGAKGVSEERYVVPERKHVSGNAELVESSG